MYLRGELGKLKNPDHARELLDRTACRLSAFALPETAQSLAAALPSQAAVDAFVDALSEGDLIALTDCYSWRNNGVPDKLRRARTTKAQTVATEDITLSDAEPNLKPVFRELSRRLADIATDPRVQAVGPYATPERRVD